MFKSVSPISNLLSTFCLLYFLIQCAYSKIRNLYKLSIMEDYTVNWSDTTGSKCDAYLWKTVVLYTAYLYLDTKFTQIWATWKNKFLELQELQKSEQVWNKLYSLARASLVKFGFLQ